MVKAVCFLDFFPFPVVSLPPSAQRLLGSFWFITQTCPEGRLLSPPELPWPLLPGPIHQVNRLEENRSCLSCQPEINHSSDQHRLPAPPFSCLIPASKLPSSWHGSGRSLALVPRLSVPKRLGMVGLWDLGLLRPLRQRLVLLGHPCASWEFRVGRCSCTGTWKKWQH